MSQSFAIIANGPFLAETIIEEAIQGRVIIALDGAADKLLALGIKPDVILGDFDSIHPKTQHYWGITNDFATMSDHALPYVGHHHITIVPTKDQSKTDLVKAIHYCDAQNAADIAIICASYGREDHHEANKLALRTEYRCNRPMILHSEVQTLRWAKDESIALQGEVGDYCGFVSTYPGYGCSTGLRYPCDHIDSSLCNTLSAPVAHINVVGEALVFMPPQLVMQRILMTLPEPVRFQQKLLQAEKIARFFSTPT